MSEPHTLEAGASDPIRLMQVAQATMALACLATKEIEPRAKMQEAEAAIYDVLTAAGGKIDPSAAALASSAGPESVPQLSNDAVRQIVRENIASSWDDRGEKKLAAAIKEGKWDETIGFKDVLRGALLLRDTLLVTPSGRPDTPPAGGGAVEGDARERIARLVYEEWLRHGQKPDWVTWEELPLISPEDYECCFAVADRVLPAAPAAPEPAAGGGREIVRLREDSAEYEVLGEAEAEICEDRGDNNRFGTCRTIYEGKTLVIYRSLTTGKLWCCFTDEFRDGRFETVTDPATSSTPAEEM